MKRLTVFLLLALATLGCVKEESINTTVSSARPLVGTNTSNNPSKTQPSAQSKDANSQLSNSLPSASTIANAPSNRGGHRINNATGSSGGDYYINSEGVRVRRPVQSSTIPPGATARCRDGSYSGL